MCENDDLVFFECLKSRILISLALSFLQAGLPAFRDIVIIISSDEFLFRHFSFIGYAV